MKGREGQAKQFRGEGRGTQGDSEGMKQGRGQPHTAEDSSQSQHSLSHVVILDTQWTHSTGTEQTHS